MNGKSMDSPQFAFEHRNAVHDSATKLVPTISREKSFKVDELMRTFWGTKSEIKAAETISADGTGTLIAS
jgi:hypothetical protein